MRKRDIEAKKRQEEREKERQRRIILVGTFFLQTGKSTREIADYFTNNQDINQCFSISYVTVWEYIQKYKELYPNQKDAIDAAIKANTEDTIDDEKVQERMTKAAILHSEGFTIEQIAETLEENYWTIYRDLNNRFKAFDEEIYVKEIKPGLEDNSMGNLKKHGSK